MNWSTAKQKLFGSSRREPLRTDVVRGPRARAASLCIVSGKGGTGKSVVCASLATLFGTRGRTLLFDGDLGVGNAHILQNVSPATNVVDVVEGRAELSETLVECGGALELVGAGSGVPRMAELTVYELHLLASGIEELETEYRTLLVDSAAGISRQTVRFASACDVVLLVTTPDLTAMTDAYALLKVLAARRPDVKPLLLVNRAASEDEAQDTTERIARVAERFLGERPRLLAWCPEDAEVRRCGNARQPVVLGAPDSSFARCIARAATALTEELEASTPGGFGRRLVADVGFQGPTPRRSR